MWWTISGSSAPSFERRSEPVGRKREVIVCHKACDPWSDKNKNGNRLDWNSLHPKAREFLFTESTLQSLTEDNARYALALIEGADLSPWHARHDWQSKAEKAQAKRGVGTIFNAKQRAAVQMVMTAHQTAQFANGQEVLRTVKNKDILFPSKVEFENYLLSLIDLQEGMCAVTGLPLQYHGEHDDAEMLCSLDRIDSAGHYAQGNLQIVCRFVNKWKNNADDQEFRRLINVVRSTGSI
jgi:hypothetical protein